MPTKVDTTASNAQYPDLPSISNTFPLMDTVHIIRDNWLSTIDSMLYSKIIPIDIILIEGEPGVGKTTLLAQFALQHRDNTISLFIRSASRWAYDPFMLRLDLCNQMNVALGRDEVSDPSLVSDGTLRSTFTQLVRLCGKRKDLFFFVLDGIDEIPIADLHVRSLILDLLPVGLPGFRCLISTNQALPAEVFSKAKRKNLVLPGFTVGEVISFFQEEVDLTEEQAVKINKVCRGIPGHLASIKRLVKSGVSFSDLLKDIPNCLPDLFELEWRSIDPQSDMQQLALAVMAFDKKAYTIDELAKIIAADFDLLRAQLSTLAFIDTENEGSGISYVSDQFRSFAAQKLDRLKQSVHEIIIKHLEVDPDSHDTLVYLPEHLEEAGRLKELLSYLSHSNLALAQQKSALGYKTAKSLRRYDEILRFALTRSILSEMADTDVLKSEVEALISLDNNEGALALAQSAVVKERRLDLLCALAKIQKTKGIQPEEELINQVRQLLQQIDVSNLGPKALGIATNMFSLSPDLAVELAEKAFNSEGYENSRDLAFAALSVTAESDNRDSVEISEIAKARDKLAARIKSPDVQKMRAALAFTLNDYSALGVVAEVKRLTKSSDQIAVLRQWIVENPDDEGMHEVLEAALVIASSEMGMDSSLSLYRDLARGLPSVGDLKTLTRLIDIFDASIKRLKKNADHDYLSLQIMLATQDVNIDRNRAFSRVLDIYVEIGNILNKKARLSLLGELIACIEAIDPARELEDLGLHSGLMRDFDKLISDLLDNSSDHLKHVGDVLRALAIPKTAMAMSIALRLNLEKRRDDALIIIADELLRRIKNQELEALFDIRGKLVSKEKSDNLVLDVLESISEQKGLSPSLFDGVVRWFSAVIEIGSAATRCRAICFALVIVTAAPSGSIISDCNDSLRSELSLSLSAIDSLWVRVEAAFNIAKLLSKIDRQLASSYLALATSLRREAYPDSDATASALLVCLDLAIRSYNGLLLSDAAQAEDLERLSQVIESVSSAGIRAMFFAELAIRLYLNRKEDQADRIVERGVVRALGQIDQRSRDWWERVSIVVGPALHRFDEAVARQYFQMLPIDRRDEAASKSARFFLLKISPGEPFFGKSMRGIDLAPKDARKICGILEMVNTDYNFCGVLKDFGDALDSKRIKDNFRQPELDEILAHIDSAIALRLPDPANIKHRGYEFAARSIVLRLRKAPFSAWAQLISGVRQIDNESDRVFVMGIVAASLSRRFHERSVELFLEASRIAETLPVTVDKCSRYRHLAREVSRIDPSKCREFIQRAMAISLQDDDDDQDLIVERSLIIDTANEVCPEVVDNLLKAVDSDGVGTKKERGQIKVQRSFLELVKGLANLDNERVQFDNIKKLQLPAASERLLGALNARRLSPHRMDRMVDILDAADGLPLTHAHSVFSWLVENIVQYYGKTSEAKTYIRPAFEASIQGANLIRTIVSCVERLNSTSDSSVSLNFTKGFVVRAGGRDAGLDFISRWLRGNLGQYIKICDPYFGPEDLDVLKLVLRVNPSCVVKILTSEQHQSEWSMNLRWEESYRAFWRSISEQDPPDTQIFVVGAKPRGRLPIHDRWWLTEGSGLRLGTSFNSIGLQKDSEISYMRAEEAAICESDVDLYFGMLKKEHQGEKLTYSVFNLL